MLREKLEAMGAAVAFAESGEFTMAEEIMRGTENRMNKNDRTTTSVASKKRKKAAQRAVVFGVVSVSLYLAVFSFTQPIMSYFTKGGFYAVLPVLTVFLFSYVHGSFASNVWTALGIEASHSATKTAEKPVQAEKRVEKKRVRPRPTLRA